MNTREHAGRILKLAWQIEHFSGGREQLFKRKHMIAAQIGQLLFVVLVIAGDIFISMTGVQQQGFFECVLILFIFVQLQILHRQRRTRQKCNGTTMQQLLLTVNLRKHTQINLPYSSRRHAVVFSRMDRCALRLHSNDNERVQWGSLFQRLHAAPSSAIAQFLDSPQFLRQILSTAARRQAFIANAQFVRFPFTLLSRNEEDIFRFLLLMFSTNIPIIIGCAYTVPTHGDSIGPRLWEYSEVTVFYGLQLLLFCATPAMLYERVRLRLCTFLHFPSDNASKGNSHRDWEPLATERRRHTKRSQRIPCAYRSARRRDSRRHVQCQQYLRRLSALLHCHLFGHFVTVMKSRFLSRTLPTSTFLPQLLFHWSL